MHTSWDVVSSFDTCSYIGDHCVAHGFRLGTLRLQYLTCGSGPARRLQACPELDQAHIRNHCVQECGCFVVSSSEASK
jgi:hypothetical protein